MRLGYISKVHSRTQTLWGFYPWMKFDNGAIFVRGWNFNSTRLHVIVFDLKL